MLHVDNIMFLLLYRLQHPPHQKFSFHLSLYRWFSVSTFPSPTAFSPLVTNTPFSISICIFVWCVAAAAKSLQSCPTLCNPIDGSPPGSAIPGIPQARRLERVSISFSSACLHAKSLQSCPTLCECDPMDSSPPGSSVHRILLARTLEWGAISFSVWCVRVVLCVCVL